MTLPVRAFVVVLWLLALGAVATAAPGRIKAEAKAHLDRGLKLYQSQKYDEAIVELRAGLAIDPQPDLLYALGQAERRNGHCARAIEYYESCLALVKDPSAAAAVRVQIERCRVESAPESRPAPASKSEPLSEPAARPEPPPEPAGPPPDDAATLKPVEFPPEAPAPALRPWHRDPLAVTALSLGLAGLGVGGALVGVAESQADRAASSYQAFADARGAVGLWTGGVISLGVGGALVAVAVIRFAVVAVRQSRAGAR